MSDSCFLWSSQAVSPGLTATGRSHQVCPGLLSWGQGPPARYPAAIVPGVSGRISAGRQLTACWGGPCGQHSPVPLLRDPGQRPAFSKPQHPPSPPPEQRCRFSVASGEWGVRTQGGSRSCSAGPSGSLFHSQVLGPGPAPGAQRETTEPGPALVGLPLWWGERRGAIRDKTVSKHLATN